MIEAVDFKGANVVIAKDQPEFKPLPAMAFPEEGYIITCWKLAPEDLKTVNENGGHIYLKVITGNKPLQPLRIMADLSDDIELTRDG
ncbi:hypothetical protein LCGC14_1095600 [marine sediment metagenome]|uniref:Uncharacterized protein n=1 Tax=marine sediment metagenome TaxID=412755 RepID=A0A0F9MB17_9ZZZZ